MSGEREYMGNHAAVGEDLGWIADGVDGRFVEASILDDRAHLGEEGRPAWASTSPDAS